MADDNVKTTCEPSTSSNALNASQLERYKSVNDTRTVMQFSCINRYIQLIDNKVTLCRSHVFHSFYS